MNNVSYTNNEKGCPEDLQVFPCSTFKQTNTIFDSVLLVITPALFAPKSELLATHRSMEQSSTKHEQIDMCLHACKLVWLFEHRLLDKHQDRTPTDLLV